MFKKDNKSEAKRQQTELSKETYVPKWEHPKILLIDMENDVEIALKSEGFNAVVGSFDIPYKVPKSDKYEPVVMNRALLPNYTEQEIIVVEIVPPEASEKPEGEKHTSPGENDWWASCNKGIIDPRPRFMAIVQEAFDRILVMGGSFIIFADLRVQQKLKWAHLGVYDQFVEVQNIDADNWGFLSVLNSNNIETGFDHGFEMAVIDSQSTISQLLKQYLRNSSFECTLIRKSYGGIEEKNLGNACIKQV